MNRRRFLRRSGAVALFSTLAGCSTDDPSDRRNQQPGTEATPAGTEEAEQAEKPATLRERARIPAEVGDVFETVLNVQELGADLLNDRIPENGHVKGTLEGRLRSAYTFLGDIFELDAAQSVQVGIEG